MLFGKYRGTPSGTIALRGAQGDTPFERTLDVAAAAPDSAHAALRHLWARHAIARLSDAQRVSPTAETKERITDLGLQYNLLTKYTSFVAIDTEIRADGTDATTVRQPVPLPQGVPDEAVPNDAVLGNNVEFQASLDFSESLSRTSGEGEIYVVVENQPELIDGLAWVQETLEYPPEACEKGIEGRVFVQFVVDETGQAKDVTVTRGVHPLLDEAAR